MAGERELEKLFLESADFETLAAEMDRFCPFDAVGMDRQEIRHGFFLRYVLDPQRPHGFGSECLRGFMWAAASALSEDGHASVRPLDVHLMDLDLAIVERERDSIDLLIQIPSSRLVVAVELKIDATEHSGQLGRYRRIVEKDFPAQTGWRHVFLFLTKRGDQPSQQDGAGWKTLPLDSIAAALDRVVETGVGQPEARMMLGAYVNMLRRRHLTDQRMEDLARGLWREHREALEFLMTRRPDMTSELLSRLSEQQQQVTERLSHAAGTAIVPDHTTRFIVRFAVPAWDMVPGMLSGTGWKPSNRLMLFEVFRGGKGDIRCQFELGPGSASERDAIFTALKAAGADVGGNWALSPQWRQLAAKTLITPKEEEDTDSQFAQIIDGAASFLKLQVPRYHAVLEQLMPAAGS